MTVLGSLQVPRVMRRFGTQYVFVGSALAVTFTVLLFLFQNALLAFVAVLPAAAMSGLSSATFRVVVQKHAAATQQATALSILALSNGLAMGIVAGIIGVAMDRTSALTITLTLVVAGVFLSAGSFAAVRHENLRDTP